MKALRAVNNFLASASLALAMLIIFIMVAALFLSAATRYITGTGFAWFIELPPVLVSWLVFPLLGPLLKKGQHIKVDFLTPLLSKKNKEILFLIVNIVALLSAWDYYDKEWSEVKPNIPFKQLPMLVVDKKHYICQSMAIMTFVELLVL